MTQVDQAREQQPLSPTDIQLGDQAHLRDFVVHDQINHFYYYNSPAPPGTPDSTRQGFNALKEMMSDHQVRNVVIAFRTDFQATCEQINRLSTYKDLHDALHTLELQCYLVILREVGRFPDDETAVDTLTDYEFRLQQIVDNLQEIIERSDFVANEESWVHILKQSQAKLHDALTDSDRQPLQDAIKLMNRILSRQPARINHSLTLVAQTLRLSALVEELKTIEQQLRQISINPEKIRQFQESIENLASLAQKLKTLIQNHDQLQRLDVELRAIEGNEANLADELELSWSDLKQMVEQQDRETQAKWVTSLQPEIQSLDGAILSQNPVKIRQCFHAYCRNAREQFFRVDTDLKQFCSELRRKCEPLNLVLEVLDLE